MFKVFVLFVDEGVVGFLEISYMVIVGFKILFFVGESCSKVECVDGWDMILFVVEVV